LLGAPWYQERLTALAAALEGDPDSVRTEAAGYLQPVRVQPRGRRP
jgi:glycerol-3-phosphate O-acyltransferase